METGHLKFIVVEQGSARFESFLEAFTPEVPEDDALHITSLHQALEAYLSAPFAIFIVSSAFTEKQQASFMEDISKAPNPNGSIFVHLCDGIDGAFDKSA